MDTSNWNGAQWFIVFYILAMLISPWIFLLAGVVRTSSTFAEWLGKYLSKVINYTILVTVLWWGGFWS